MTGRQMALLDALFEQASAIPEPGRQAWLAAHCDDPEVRAELESLLRHAGAEGAANRSGFTAAIETAAAIASQPSFAAGQTIGPYRITGILGEGGMGTVYEGVRDDDEFRHTVAIKVLRLSARSETERHRFLRERQILAELDHPNIARLFDGGTAADGSPYIVMERIEGEPLIAFVNARKLSLRQRLELFRQVANAVQYAHQNLIVHRDLKPGNILVSSGPDGEPLPKLLDFGIAKLLDAEAMGAEALTATGFRLMTPDYASPEQVQGKPVTVASDVYSLGAVLYELLTGVRPHGLKTYDPGEIAERICLRDVAAPSSVAGGAARAALRGDLDTIVLKAMQKVPERRYNSAERLSEDLRRYLSGMPVLARPDTAGYRMRKFAGRHWIGLSATAAVAVALVVGVAMSLYQAHQAVAARGVAEIQRQAAERERGRAESEAQVARTEQDRSERRLTQMVELADRSLYDVHSAIEKLPGATEARRQIVATTLQFLENLSKDAGQDDRLRLVLSAAYLKVADVQGYPTRPNLGDTQGALASYQKSLNLIEPLLAKAPENPEYLLLRLNAENNRAWVLTRTGQAARAIPALRGLLPMARKLAQLCPEDVRCLLAESGILSALTDALDNSNDYQARLQYAGLTTQSLEGALRAMPEDTRIQSELASAYGEEAAALNRRGELRGAVDRYQRSIALRERLLLRNPSDVLMRRALMIAYGNRGGNLGSPFYLNLGDVAGARESYGKALALARELAAADPSDKLAQTDLATALLFYATLDVPASEAASSLALLREADGIFEKLIAADPESASRSLRLAMVREYEGRRLEALAEPAAAVEQYRQSLAAAEKILSRTASFLSAVAQALADEQAIAELLSRQGDRAGAFEMARKAVSRAEHISPSASEQDTVTRYIAKAYRVLGTVQASAGLWGDSRISAERAAAGWHRLSAAGSGLIDQAEADRTEALLRESAAHLPK